MAVNSVLSAHTFTTTKVAGHSSCNENKRPTSSREHLIWLAFFNAAAGLQMKQKRVREEACTTCGHYHDVSRLLLNASAASRSFRVFEL